MVTVAKSFEAPIKCEFAHNPLYYMTSDLAPHSDVPHGHTGERVVC